MKRLKIFFSFMFGRNWIMPLLAVLVSIVCVAGVSYLSRQSGLAAIEERHKLADRLDWFIAPQVLLFFLLPLWLLILTVVRLIQKKFSVLWAWLCSLLAGAAMIFCLVLSVFGTMFCDTDDFTFGISVPEELAPGCSPPMAVPVHIHFQPPFTGGDDATLPPVVQQYADLCQTAKYVSVCYDEELSESAPNLEKIAATAPELLHEYKWRAYCHQALSPGFRGAPRLDMLSHPDEAGRRQNEPTAWKLQLPNQWQVSDGDSSVQENRFALKGMQLLDTALAPLATNPTREGLDSLVPPLPDKPVIILTETFQPGIYKLRLVAPIDFPAGSFTVKAREYTKGAELSTRGVLETRLTPCPTAGFASTPNRLKSPCTAGNGANTTPRSGNCISPRLMAANPAA